MDLRDLYPMDRAPALTARDDECARTEAARTTRPRRPLSAEAKAARKGKRQAAKAARRKSRG